MSVETGLMLGPGLLDESQARQWAASLDPTGLRVYTIYAPPTDGKMKVRHYLLHDPISEKLHPLGKIIEYAPGMHTVICQAESGRHASAGTMAEAEAKDTMREHAEQRAKALTR